MNKPRFTQYLLLIVRHCTQKRGGELYTTVVFFECKAKILIKKVVPFPISVSNVKSSIGSFSSSVPVSPPVIEFKSN